MTLLAYALYFAVLVGLAWALAAWMARVYAGALPPPLLRAESALLRACGAAPDRGMGWGAYALAVLAFNLVGFVLLYAILRAQGALPLNPDGIGGMAPDLAFNTAVSFVTNTNWQAYSGEAQLSYLQPDGRADGAELRQRGHRDGRGRGGDPGLCRAEGRRRSATSGST